LPVPPPFATVDGWGPRLSAATSPGSGKRCDPPRPSAALWCLLVGWPIPTHPSAWTPATLRTQPSRPPRIAAPGPASPGASVACMKDQVPAPDHGARGAWVTKTSLPSTGKARRPAHAPSSRLVRRPRRRLQFWQVFSDQAFCGSFLSGAPWSLPPSEQEQAALAPAHDIGKARAEARAKRPKPSRKRRAKPVAKSTLSTAPTSHSFPGISRRVCAQTGHASPETKPWQAAMEGDFDAVVQSVSDLADTTAPCNTLACRHASPSPARPVAIPGPPAGQPPIADRRSHRRAQGVNEVERHTLAMACKHAVAVGAHYRQQYRR